MATITLMGNEVLTVGNLPKIGTKLENFELVDKDLSIRTLSDFEGKKKIFNIFPSIDTGTCAASTRCFNEIANNLENTVIINISKDLPFALGRFCAVEGLNNVETLSDFRGNFGDKIGVTMSDSAMKGLLSRAIIVTDENNNIIHTEQVSELADEPNYEMALEKIL
jgi:thiol peroxidase